MSAGQQSRGGSLTITVSRAYCVPQETLFDYVVAYDVLPEVQHRFGPVPGVTHTSDVSGPWSVPGSHRHALRSQGSIQFPPQCPVRRWSGAHVPLGISPSAVRVRHHWRDRSS